MFAYRHAQSNSRPGQWALSALAIALLIGAGCSRATTQSTSFPGTKAVASPLEQAESLVVRAQERHAPAAADVGLRRLANPSSMPLIHSFAMARRARYDPWGGFADMDAVSQRVKSRSDAGDAMGVLAAAMDASSRCVLPEEPGDTKGDAVDALRRSLAQADAACVKALSQIPATAMPDLFDWSRQRTRWTAGQATTDQLAQAIRLNDRTLFTVSEGRIQWDEFGRAARLLWAWQEPARIEQLRKDVASHASSERAPAGLSGDVLYSENTPQGWLIIGGPGPTRYAMTEPVAAIIDLGGDDVYRGTVGASFDVNHRIGLVVDMGGNDTYDTDSFGLALGRFGVGVVIDMTGNDTYLVRDYAGGVGLCGIGILADMAGDDRYVSGQGSLASSTGGIGILCDQGGDDAYQAAGMGIAFAGPMGTSILADRKGNDVYRMVDPGTGDAAAFGIAAARGARAEGTGEAWTVSAGIALLLDGSGDDRYLGRDSSVGTAVDGGLAAVCDMEGNDIYEVGEASLGCGGEGGVAMVMDHTGDDIYRSTARLWRPGTSLPGGAGLLLDAGNGADRYEFSLIRGDAAPLPEGFGHMCDLGGNDVYSHGQAAETGSGNALSTFVDAGGSDHWSGGVGVSAIPRGAIVVEGQIILFLPENEPATRAYTPSR